MCVCVCVCVCVWCFPGLFQICPITAHFRLRILDLDQESDLLWSLKTLNTGSVDSCKWQLLSKFTDHFEEFQA